MPTLKFAPQAVLDAPLDKIATATMLRVCSGSSNPADRAAAVSATLASTTMSSGDFTKAAGASGRKVTVAQKAAISITAGGDATCVVLDDGTDILYVTTVTTQTLTAGGTVTVPSWDIEFEQAA
jgi:hypothetical protein